MNKINIRPLHDRIIVERIEERTTVGGIVIPDTVGEKPQRGLIMAVGPGKEVDGKNHKLSVEVGDEVLFGKYSGTEVQIDGKNLLVMREEDVMGVIESL